MGCKEYLNIFELELEVSALRGSESIKCDIFFSFQTIHMFHINLSFLLPHFTLITQLYCGYYGYDFFY